MNITRFENLDCWKEARILVSAVYQAAREGKTFKQDYRFRDQITAAAVSIMSNVAEGFSRRSDREFTQFLFIAKGSCGEVQSLLYVAVDQAYISKAEFTRLYEHTEVVAKLISRLITYLLASEKPKAAVKAARST